MKDYLTLDLYRGKNINNPKASIRDLYDDCAAFHLVLLHDIAATPVVKNPEYRLEVAKNELK